MSMEDLGFGGDVDPAKDAVVRVDAPAGPVGDAPTDPDSVRRAAVLEGQLHDAQKPFVDVRDKLAARWGRNVGGTAFAATGAEAEKETKKPQTGETATDPVN